MSEIEYQIDRMIPSDVWVDAKQAAKMLGRSVKALQLLRDTRQIRFKNDYQGEKKGKLKLYHLRSLAKYNAKKMAN